jgi:hypothetical protein
MTLVLCAVLAFLPCPPQEPARPVLAIEHVTVLPMDAERRLADHTALVSDGRIAALGPAAEVSVPEGALRIDGSGRFLMPGLADMHVHVWDENDLYLFVACGVTTVRNMFGSQLQLGWRERIAHDELVGPRIYTAGPIIDGPNPVWPGSVALTDPADAAKIVEEQKAAGYDFLKPYSKLSAECYEALAIAAEAEGMRMMGHVPNVLGLVDVLEAGQLTIEHLDGWAEAALGGGSRAQGASLLDDHLAWPKATDEELATVARACKSAGAWNCPTLVVLDKWRKGAEADALLARPEMRFVSPAIKGFWSPSSPMNYLQRLPEEVLTAVHAAAPHRARAVAALRDAGAGILLGTDMGNPYVTAGWALHEELANLVAAGLTPYQALRAGTADAASCMGDGDEWGTIAVGQRADLVLLEADPLDDVANAAKRAGVVLHGRWMPRDEIERELESRAVRFAGNR